MIKAPCKDCPNRSATCRKSCDPWKEYEAAHAEERAERGRRRADDQFYSSYFIEIHNKKYIAHFKGRRK